VPYTLTWAVAAGSLAFGTKLLNPGPAVWLQVPVPNVGTALSTKSKSHASPPVPASAVGLVVERDYSVV
jgi:hypothetical protein